MEKNSLLRDSDHERPRAVACAVYPQGGESACEASLLELGRLLDTAGADLVGTLTQMREKPDGTTCIGSGKMRELSALCEALDASLVVFDCELSPMQLREIEDGLDGDREVLDRSMLILDIFAAHAITSEGRLQVELAQLRYTAPRLAGKGVDMSRLGGGIGTRGPGESRLEIDRRRMKARIHALETELERMEGARATMRAARDRSGLVRCAIVGYTNAGKSTLLNTLTGAGILAEDKLFATLDPTTRQYTLPSGMKLLLTDTVGFIRNLPHHLIRAFRSTLEEAALADVILHVCDASDAEIGEHLRVTRELLRELGAAEKPCLLVLNKCDLVPEENRLLEIERAAVENGWQTVCISAQSGEGLERFLRELERIASGGRVRLQFLIPHSDGAALSQICEKGHGVEVEYLAEGALVTATVDAALRGRFAAYLAVTDEEAEADDGDT